MLAFLSGLVLVVGLVWLTLPDVAELRSGWPEETAYMELRREAAAEEGRSLRIVYRPTPLSRIPRHVQRAVLVAEDAAFYGHGGFDWHEVKTALEAAWRERRLPRGASTITQQLARNLYLSPSRDPLRKVREAMIARRLERELSKPRILELYLNVIEMGPGIFGLPAAARHYFGRDIPALSRREAAQLAASIPSPRRHNPATATRSFRWRADLVHRRAFGREEERIEVEVPEPVVEPPELAPAAAGAGAASEPPAAGDEAPEPEVERVRDAGPADPDTVAGPADTAPVAVDTAGGGAVPDSTAATPRRSSL